MFHVIFLQIIEAHKKVFTTGCVEKVLKKAEDNLINVGIVAICLAVPQVSPPPSKHSV